MVALRLNARVGCLDAITEILPVATDRVGALSHSASRQARQAKEAHERCAVGPAARATGPVDFLYLRGRWRRHCADLREERHQIEVMVCLSDLVALERHDLDRWDLHALVGRRDRPPLALDLTVVCARPGALENDSVATLNGLGDRPLGVGECLTP